MKLDVIGDIHGRCEELKRLLSRLGYEPSNGVWSHPERKALFMGDLVDRGPDVPGVLALVKGMADAGAAEVMLGNHEFGVLCWYMPDGKGDFLRPHKDRFLNYMGPSVAYFDAHPEARDLYFPWFQSLPIWMEKGGARFVHAYWGPKELDRLAGAQNLNECGWGDPRFRNSKLGRAAERLIKGPEMKLPDNLVVKNSHDEELRSSRINWWLRQASSLGELLVADIPQLAGQPIPARVRARYEARPANHPPIFIGHYGFKACPGLLAPNLACVDYQGADRKWIGAYRWNGESELRAESLVKQEAVS